MTRTRIVAGALLAVVGTCAAGAHAQSVQFRPRASYEAASSGPHQLRVADFDGVDGLDILVPAAGTDSGPGEVTLLLNNGNGTFGDNSFATNYHPWASAVGDYDEDGCIDAAICDSGGSGSAVHVYHNNCSAGMNPGAVLTAGSFPIDAVALRLDGDAHLDLAVANNVSGGVKVFLGDGLGGFTLLQNFGAGNCTALDSADFNEDGRPDLVLGTYSATSLMINNGDGTFRSGPGVASGLSGGVATGDFNHDGHADAASITHYTGVLSVSVGHGDGTLQPWTSINTGGGFVESLAAADLNRDGFDDLLYADLDGDYVRIYMNNGDGTLASPITLTTDWQTEGIAVADFDGDGWPDVAAACRNLGDSALIDIFLQIPPAPVCDADFNDDGAVNTLDVLAFLNAWNASDPRADFNGDGAVNTLDVLAFLNAWAAGC
ncbi:MAG: VCBS repeat-containing protein [Phycisphaerales bacterium]|nr:VCBS repeat-containing protein [Phycisphaerales bacterium]